MLVGGSPRSFTRRREGRSYPSYNGAQSNPASGKVADMREEIEGKEQRGGAFATTQWNLVVQAAQSDSPQAAQALERLCRAYWSPLCAYVRQWGYSPEDAQDLTQGFFA